jgi:predicted dehydrogenase
MPSRIRTATIGVGHFGRYHAQKYARLEQSELVAVCDIDGNRAAEVAAECGARAVVDYRELLGEVDAVSIVVPTRVHRDVAMAFLENGVHVLVEKPIADNLDAADDLIRMARARNCILQVGHLERFSSVGQDLGRLLTRPLYVEANRITPFRGRGTDVSIVLDLMIHDIDLILSFVDASVESVDAVGAPVLSAREDIANTRIRFANGCVATITASRVSAKNERKMRVFQPNAYVSVDFLSRKVLVARKKAGANFLGFLGIEAEEHQYADGDSLQNEIEAFLACVANGSPPTVSGEDGRRALETAILIGDSLRAHRELVRERMGDLAVDPAPLSF